MPFLSDVNPGIRTQLFAMCADGCETEAKAMLRNILAEHRLSSERLKALVGDSSKWTDPGKIKEFLDKYKKRHVNVKKRDGKPPCYEGGDNGGNRITMPPDGLGTVINLSRLDRVYRFAQNHLASFSRYVQVEASVDGVNEFLKQRLEGPERRQFLKALFRAMKEYRASEECEGIYPTWAARWEHLQPFLLPKNHDRWRQSVGVRAESSAWWTVVRYSSSRVEPEGLFRPTQLEAGWYPEHFPPPLETDLQVGGYSMDLSAEAGIGLVSEYIHRQIDFEIEDWDAAGGLVGFVDKPSPCELVSARRAHWERLCNEYGEQKICNWMPSAS